MHVPVRFLCQSSDLCVLCRHSCYYVWYSIVFIFQSLLSVGCTYVALTFWKVFEQFLLVEESRKICRTLLIYTNRVQDLMLFSFVHDNFQVKQVSDEMKDFFTSGDGAKCKVTLIQVKVMNSKYVCCLSMTYWEVRVTKFSAGPCVCCRHVWWYFPASLLIRDDSTMSRLLLEM